MGTLIYSELPYASVLDIDRMWTHCANCFRTKPHFPCPKLCAYAMYCDEKCANDDSRWHKYECDAYLELVKLEDKPMAEARVRILGRLLTRLQHDKGVVSISQGFPSFAKDRKFSDLLSHYDEIKKETSSTERLKSICSQFFQFFASTPLKETSPKTVQVLFCTFRINSFCISNDTGTLGLGLYLNTSRFNHSCQPTARAWFVGNCIQISATPGVHPDEYSTEKRFDDLTIDYGTTLHASRGCYITLSRQRIDSLKMRYFFRCLCPVCADSVAIKLEESASNRVCQRCQVPYIWTRKGQLKQTCGCHGSPVPEIDEKEKRVLTELHKRWKSVMDQTEYMQNNERVIELCEPLLKLAKRFWHSTDNMRLAQLTERLSAAYSFINEVSGKASAEWVECYAAMAVYYDRMDFTQNLAQQYRRLVEKWSHQSIEPGVGK